MKQELLTLLPPDFPWKENLHCFDALDSTSTYAKLLAQQGAPHGTAVIARQQTGGRGRLGRQFASPQGGLYLTVLLRPQCTADKLQHLTCCTGVAAAEAIRQVTGLTPGLKWINDLVLNAKKVGGILAELSVAPDGYVSYALLGIGINCHAVIPPELSAIAISLEDVLGTSVSPVMLAAMLLPQLQKLSDTLLTEKSRFMEAYREKCVTIGKDVLILRGDEKAAAQALSVDEGGSLLVQYPDGRREAIQSGEVSVRGLFGYSP